jgi:hypothetical protein
LAIFNSFDSGVDNDFLEPEPKLSEFASVIKRDAWTDLAPVVDKGKLDFVARPPGNICDLSGNPALFFVCEPDPGSLGVNVLCHGPGGRRGDYLALALFP